MDHVGGEICQVVESSSTFLTNTSPNNVYTEKHQVQPDGVEIHKTYQETGIDTDTNLVAKYKSHGIIPKGLKAKNPLQSAHHTAMTKEYI